MNMEMNEQREKEIAGRYHTGVLLARLMAASGLSDEQIEELKNKYLE